MEKNEAKIETQEFQLPVQESILMKPLSVRNSQEEKKVDWGHLLLGIPHCLLHCKLWPGELRYSCQIISIFQIVNVVCSVSVNVYICVCVSIIRSEARDWHWVSFLIIHHLIFESRFSLNLESFFSVKLSNLQGCRVYLSHSILI